MAIDANHRRNWLARQCLGRGAVGIKIEAIFLDAIFPLAREH